MNVARRDGEATFSLIQIKFPMFMDLAFISMPGGPEWIIIFIIVLLLFGAK